MARYTGPKTKIARKFGEPIYGPDKAYEKRVRDNKNYPSGQHGAVRKKLSDYALHLKEKQKIRYTYLVSEKQFARYYHEAARRKGVTGTILLQILFFY